MNNLIGLLFLFFLINSCNSIPDKIIPNWRVGDTKLIHYTHEGIVSINDSVVNINVEKKHLVRVIEETNDFYILEFTNKMTLNVDFLANGDTIINDEMKFYELLSKFPQFDVPYEIKFSKVGEPIDFVDWEIVIGEFIKRLLEVADSIDFDKYSNKYIESQARSAFEVEDRLKKALLQEVSEMFEVYGVVIPEDSTMREYQQVQNPQNGQLVDVFNTTRLVGIEDDIVKLSFTLDFDESQLLDDNKTSMEDIFNESKEIDFEMSNERLLYWDVKSTWPVKINKTESLKKGNHYIYKMMTKIEVIDK